MEEVKASHTLGGAGKLDTSKLLFIITDKAKTRRGGGRRCRCYERWVFSILARLAPVVAATASRGTLTGEQLAHRVSRVIYLYICASGQWIE
jgi:hypothetical protein